MAQSGYTPILIYASGTATNVPLNTNLTSSSSGAELALNYADGKLYFKNSSNVVTLLASSATAINSFSAGTTGLTPSTATTGAVTLAGTLIAANGGTGLTAPGSSGNILTSNGTAWTSAPPASVTTVTTISFGTTGLTPSTATSGVVTVAGTLAIANGGTNSTATATAGGAGYGTGTAHAYTAVGTAGQVLTSNGASAPTWSGVFPTGTRLAFQQTAAPTGWTKDTTAAINDSILRLVTGTVTPSGGSQAFSTWNALTATSAYTLETADIPSHTHTYSSSTTAASTNSKTTVAGTGAGNTGATGGGGSHTHGLTNGIKYYDFIIASAN